MANSLSSKDTEKTLRALERIQELTPAQFGFVSDAFKKVGAGLKLAGGTVMRGLEAEEKFIGRPIARALVKPFEPILPEGVENFLRTTGAMLFTPSNVLMTVLPIGRTLTAARLLSRLGFGVVRGARSVRETAPLARLALRSLYNPSTLKAAQISLAERTGRPFTEIVRESLRDPDLAMHVLDLDREARLASGRLNPLRWSSKQRAIGRDDMDFLEGRLFGIPRNATREEARRHFQNQPWYTSLLRGDAIDPRRSDNLGLYARTWSGLKALYPKAVETGPPAVGRALGTAVSSAAGALKTGLIFVQPMALRSQPVRRAFLFASSHTPTFMHNKEAREKGALMILESVFDRKFLYEGAKSAEYLAPTSNYIGPAARLANPAVAKVVGTFNDVVRNPYFYRLSDDQRQAVKMVQRLLDLDREEAVAFGVNMGDIPDYWPQRLNLDAISNPEEMELVQKAVRGVYTNPKYAKSIRGRHYKDWDDFVRRAEEIRMEVRAQLPTKLADRLMPLSGAAVETDTRRLFQWRFGETAAKKGEQLFYKALQSNPETAGLVEHRFTLGAQLREELLKPDLRARLAKKWEVPESEVAERIARLNDEGLEDVIKGIGGGRRLQVRAHELSLLQTPDRLIDVPGGAGMLQDAQALLRGSISDLPDNTIERMVGTLRGALLSFDASPLFMVQGVRLFSAGPEAWLSQIGEAASWMLTRDGKRMWAIQNLPRVRYWTQRGMTLGNVLDVNPDLLQRSLLGKAPPVWAAGAANRHMMDLVQVAKLHVADTMLSSFLIAKEHPGTFELIAKLPWATKVVQKLGKNRWATASADELAEAIGENLNNAIGPVNFTQVTGQTRPSVLEQLMVLTPSWTRGNLGVIANAAKVGPKGVMARWLLMNQLALASLVASKVSMSLGGGVPSFNPMDNDFLSAKTPWGRFNVLPAMPIYRMAARLTTKPIDVERWTDFTRFAETRMGQVPRIAVDLIQGTDFLGRKIDDKSAYAIKELLPIMGQEILESTEEGGVSGQELGQRLTLEFLGASVIPKTPFALIHDRVEEMTGRPFDDVSDIEKRRLFAEDPILQKLQARSKKYREERGGPRNQFFGIIEEQTRNMQSSMNEFLDRRSASEPGFLADYGRLASEMLSTRAEAGRFAKISLWGSEAEADKDIQTRGKTTAQDELAVAYWTTRPELEHCRLQGSDGRETCEDDGWRAFRERRQEILDEAVKERVFPSLAAARRYIVEEWAATRWTDPRAQELERRRVLAQEAAGAFFEESPYLLPDGRPMPKELLREVFRFRGEFDNLTSQLKNRIREAKIAENPALGEVPSAVLGLLGERFSLPSGVRKKLMLALLSRAATPLRRDAILFELVWNSKYKDFLRNPRRDEIMAANPDMIKFFPEDFAQRLRADILYHFRNDPEILAIASGQVH